MRHMVDGRKLGRKTAHRLAMFSNMCCSLIDHGRIETTLNKAKELRSFADRMITLGKKDSLAARRQAFDFLRSRDSVVRLFGDLAPRFKDRQGGYTRLLHLGFRLGDSSPMALIEYIPGEGEHAKQGDSKAKKAAAPKKEKVAKAPKAPKAEKPAKAPKVKKEAAPKAKAAKKETKEKAAAKPKAKKAK